MFRGLRDSHLNGNASYHFCSAGCVGQAPSARTCVIPLDLSPSPEASTCGLISQRRGFRAWEQWVGGQAPAAAQGRTQVCLTAKLGLANLSWSNLSVTVVVLFRLRDHELFYYFEDFLGGPVAKTELPREGAWVWSLVVELGPPCHKWKVTWLN